MFDGIKRAFGMLGPSEPTQLLSADVFHEALGSAFDLELLRRGFEQAKPVKWVRSNKPALREVIELYWLKSGSAVPRWGFSLDFAPHVVNGAVRWHRTPKSALLDVVWDPLDFDGLEGWTLSRFTALADLPHVAELFAAKACGAALTDLAKAQQVSDLPPIYLEWETRRAVRFAKHNYVQAPIGEAFVLGRLGLPGAHDLLSKAIERHDYGETVSHRSPEDEHCTSSEERKFRESGSWIQ